MRMQECWEIMYDTVNTVSDCTRIATGVVSTLKIKPDRMLAGACVCVCRLLRAPAQPYQTYHRTLWEQAPHLRQTGLD